MEYKGILFGWFETGNEGTSFALQEFEHISEDGKSWSYDGLQVMYPGDHLVIKCEGKEIFSGVLEGVTCEDVCYDDKVADTYHEKYVTESGLVAGFANYPMNPQHGQLHIGNYWVHWIPTNVDLDMWYDIFFTDPEKYTGILTKIHQISSKIYQ